jgi:hypothetical protein
MKTTLDIADDLLDRAKKHARRTGRTLRAVVEEGLQAVLNARKPERSYVLPDRAVGKRGDPNPLEALSWQDLRDEIYGGR